MGLSKVIDGLLVGTHYLAWVLAVVCIPGSIVLMLANLTLGIGAVAVFLAALLLAVGLSVLIMPKLVSDRIEVAKKVRIPAVILCVAAVALMGITYAMCGGFPVINLLFV